MSDGGVRSQRCPSSRDIYSWLEGGLAPEAAGAIARHVADCPACTGEAKLARSFVETGEPAADRSAGLEHVLARTEATIASATGRRRPRWLPLSLAVGSGLVAAGLLFEFGIPFASHATSPNMAPTGAPIYRGQAIDLVEPVGDLDAAPASFVWDAVPGASSYRLRVRDASGVVRHDATCGEPRCAVPPGLVTPATRLTWSVRALDDAGRVVASSAEASFLVKPHESEEQGR
jgi:hypothetical protein